MFPVNKKLTDFIMNCQIIEEQLRVSIYASAAQIRLALQELQQKRERSLKISYFLPVDKTIQDASLGELIKMGKKFILNKELIKDLTSLKNMRNNIVHKIFIRLCHVGNQNNLDDSVLNKIMNSNLDKVLKLMEKCQNQLSDFIIGE